MSQLLSTSCEAAGKITTLAEGSDQVMMEFSSALGSCWSARSGRKITVEVSNSRKECILPHCLWVSAPCADWHAKAVIKSSDT